MTDNGLRKLRALLSDDSERAAELYLNLQGKLIRYFAWNQCLTPEEFADQVLDRVARRVSEGVLIPSVTKWKVVPPFISIALRR